jgi:hypothetical protein
MSPPTTTFEKVRRRIHDLSATNPLAEDYTVLEEAINAALTRYSQDRPREIVEDITGNGESYYALTGAGKVVASWSDGTSQIRSIDYPASAVADNVDPRWLDPDLDWRYYRDETVLYLRFISHSPAASETARITYTAPHTHSTTADTVPAGDLDALCDLAAHYACLALATKAAASQDSVIAADSTNYRDGQLRFKQQAEAWFKSYSDRMGIVVDKNGNAGVAGAGATGDWNRYGTIGWPYLTHRMRWR